MYSFSTGKTALTTEERREAAVCHESDAALAIVFYEEQKVEMIIIERKQRLQNFTTKLRIKFYDQHDRVPTYAEMAAIKKQAIETFNIMEPENEQS